MTADRTRPPGAPAGPDGRRTGMNQAHRFRALAAAAAVMALASGCGEGGAPAASSASSTPTPKYDKATARACELADKAAQGSGKAADKAAESALSTASTSDVPALREIAEKYEPTGSRMDMAITQTGALKISTWCWDHGLLKP